MVGCQLEHAAMTPMANWLVMVQAGSMASQLQSPQDGTLSCPSCEAAKKDEADVVLGYPDPGFVNWLAAAQEAWPTSAQSLSVFLAPPHGRFAKSHSPLLAAALHAARKSCPPPFPNSSILASPAACSVVRLESWMRGCEGGGLSLQTGTALNAAMLAGAGPWHKEMSPETGQVTRFPSLSCLAKISNVAKLLSNISR
jgi:hypothetical protein